MMRSQENFFFLKKFGALESESKDAINLTEEDKVNIKKAAAIVDECVEKIVASWKGECSGYPPLLGFYKCGRCKCALPSDMSDCSEP